MIIDYKNELLHQLTAIKSIVFAYEQYKINIFRGCLDDKIYCAPLTSIISCIAGSHKLDYIRLCCDSHSRQSKIYNSYQRELKDHDLIRAAVAKYQSASQSDRVDGMKPYQIINALARNSTLNLRQLQQGRQWGAGIKKGFQKLSQQYGLQVGQRLYRGVSITSNQLNQYQQAIATRKELASEGFISTTLSESIALAFSVLSDSKRFEKISLEANQPHLPAVIELTNRQDNLPFIVPDALRKPQHNQGQMEILLEDGIKIQPTYIDSGGRYVKIYADIAA